MTQIMRSFHWMLLLVQQIMESVMKSKWTNFTRGRASFDPVQMPRIVHFSIKTVKKS